MSAPSTTLPAVSTEAERLARHLVRSRGTFSLAFVRWNHPGREAAITARLRGLCGDLKLREVSVAGGPERLLSELRAACASDERPDALFVYGLQRAFPDFQHCREDDRPPVLAVLNLQREELRRRLSCAVVLWLPEHALGLIARGAPDFWSWRSGIFDFELPAASRRLELAEIRQSGQSGPIVPREQVPDTIARLLALWQDITAAGPVAPRERDTALGIAQQLLDLYGRADEFSLAEHWRDQALELLADLTADPETTPVQRAGWQVEVGTLWNRRPLGNPANNQLRAIQSLAAALQVYTEADFPQEWAKTQNILGIAYRNLPTGDCGEKLRRAIECYQAALRVYTEADCPQDWATMQNNLGIAYGNLPARDRSENLRRSIECFRAALRVNTEADFPHQWAMTQNNLGGAYSSLPTGDRGEDLRRAIECYQAALRVCTDADFSQQWAMTQNNLEVAYGNLPTGVRGENLRLAIECYHAALRVYTEAHFPQDWAMTQNNLGIAYRNLANGDRDQNVRRAIECYEAALRVYTEADFPQDWAWTQNNLGVAYRSLPTGDRGENLRGAIQCYQAALRVRTERDFPEQWAKTEYNLASTFRALAEECNQPTAAEQARAAFARAERGFRRCGLDADAARAREALDELAKSKQTGPSPAEA